MGGDGMRGRRGEGAREGKKRGDGGEGREQRGRK